MKFYSRLISSQSLLLLPFLLSIVLSSCNGESRSNLSDGSLVLDDGRVMLLRKKGNLFEITKCGEFKRVQSIEDCANFSTTGSGAIFRGTKDELLFQLFEALYEIKFPEHDEISEKISKSKEPIPPSAEESKLLMEMYDKEIEQIIAFVKSMDLDTPKVQKKLQNAEHFRDFYKSNVAPYEENMAMRKELKGQLEELINFYFSEEFRAPLVFRSKGSQEFAYSVFSFLTKQITIFDNTINLALPTEAGKRIEVPFEMPDYFHTGTLKIERKFSGVLPSNYREAVAGPSGYSVAKGQFVRLDFFKPGTWNFLFATLRPDGQNGTLVKLKIVAIKEE